MRRLLRPTCPLRLLCRLCLLCLLGLCAPFGEAATTSDLIGAWRLVDIEVSAPSGKKSHPFYQSHSTGLLIYDASGWMSVQISAPQRAAFPVPTQRSAPPAGQDALSKAAAFDSYYAYVGTWNFDEAKSVVTHHVESALLEAEVGVSYSQVVSLEGSRLTFTTHVREHGEGVTYTKVWERAVR